MHAPGGREIQPETEPVPRPLALADPAVRADSGCLPDEQMIAGAAASCWRLAVNLNPWKGTVMPGSTRSLLAAFLLVSASALTAGAVAAQSLEASTQALSLQGLAPIHAP